MAIYRNKYYTGRQHDCTNLVACEAPAKPETADDRWVPATNYVLQGLTQLWTENGVRYYGYL